MEYPVCSQRHDGFLLAQVALVPQIGAVVLLTAAMMVVEIIVGWLSGSMALLADGFHMATHAGALGITLFAYRFAQRHRDNPAYSFGTGKVSELAGFASAIILGCVAFSMVFESLLRLLSPQSIAYDEALWVAIIGLAVNFLSVWLLRDRTSHVLHDHQHHDNHHNHHHQVHVHEHGPVEDKNYRAAYLHVLADALTSILAIFALLLGKFFGWFWLDPVMGIVGALVIAGWARGLIVSTAQVLLDKEPEMGAPTRRTLELLATHHINVTDIHIWQIAPGAHAAIIAYEGGATPQQIGEWLVPLRFAHLTIACAPSAQN